MYPEGHPKRIDQDSQGINADTPSHPKNKKKGDRNLLDSSPNTVTPEEPNDISASDAETQSGDEHEPGDNMDNDVHNNAQPRNDEDVEIEPTVNPDNPQPKRYDKNDFTARKHGKEREPWVQRTMPFPPKPSKKKDDECHGYKSDSRCVGYERMGRALATARLYEFRPLYGGGNSPTSQCSGSLLSSGIWITVNC